ncbi:helix-turn-helix domain-containing protein [Flavobacterium cerinum]|uniref:Helix-turn-helix domain-containing protein n=1 Tax=Flavobacterium cerinum TaxID=2502784 RepID=A0A3S3QKJ6_9FLAO|nr:helix-turn-helix domain-containing protein [Flavobacterium cerinum]RWW99678.1 helix-turn-helix domain-containing protein [Flavobacterium cerinum]
MSRLKQIREQQNLTQEELSEKSGISVRTIQRIEAGTLPKGHTLKMLSRSLEIQQSALQAKDGIVETKTMTENDNAITADIVTADFSKIKLINLSSVLFVVLPPLNILAPILLSSLFKQKNEITKQIISVQILWTILAPIVFMLGIFLKLESSFTLVLMITIVLSNIVIILINAAGIDSKKNLLIKLNFSII